MKTYWKNLYQFIKQVLLQCIVGNFFFFFFTSIMFFFKIADNTIVDYWEELFAWLIILPIMGLPIYVGTTLATIAWFKRYRTNGIGYSVLIYIFVAFIYVFKFLERLMPFSTSILLVGIFVSFIVSILLVLVYNIKSY